VVTPLVVGRNGLGPKGIIGLRHGWRVTHSAHGDDHDMRMAAVVAAWIEQAKASPPAVEH